LNRVELRFNAAMELWLTEAEAELSAVG